MIKTCKTNYAIPFPEYNDKSNAYKGTGNDINNPPCKKLQNITPRALHGLKN